MNSTTQPYRGNDRLLLGIILGVLAFWLFAQTTLNINVDMARDLGIETGIMSIAVSITALFSGIFIVVLGGLADRIGRVKMVRIGLYFSIFGSLLIAVTPRDSAAAPVLVVGRILQGLSGAAIMPASLALLKAYWDGKGRQRAISLWSMGSWGGMAFASLFGGLMVEVGWRYIFFAAALASALGLLLIKGTPESKATSQTHQKLDILGIFVFMVAMIALQILVIRGAKIGFSSPIGLSLCILTPVLFVLFYYIEVRRDYSFVDFKLFKNSIFTGATISNFMLNATAGVLIVSLALLQLGGNLSALQAGLFTLGYAISIVLFIRVGEKLLQRFGARRPMVWGSLLVGLSIVLLLCTHVMTTTYMVLAIIAYTLFGIGLAFYATPSTDAALSNLPDVQAGAGSGIYKMASSLGSALGVAISAGVFAAFNYGQGHLWLSGVITFVGRQDNLAVRQAATIALCINLCFVLLALLSIMLTIPKHPSTTKR